MVKIGENMQLCQNPQNFSRCFAPFLDEMIKLVLKEAAQIKRDFLNTYL